MTIFQTFTREPAKRPTTAAFQSSAAQSTLVVLRHFLSSEIRRNEGTHTRYLVFNLLHRPQDLLVGINDPAVDVHNWLDRVPGYGAPTGFHPGKDILATIEQALTANSTGTSVPLCVVIDSVDTLASDIGSHSETYGYLRQVQDRLSSRPGSLLILHGVDVNLISLFVQPEFSPSVLYLKGHPYGLVTHLATEYLTPPPPYSPVPKFWSIFTPVSERRRTINELVFGTQGQVQKDIKEILLEVLIRRPSGQGSKKRGVERELEAWSSVLGPCEWTQLESLRPVWSKQSTSEPAAAPNPTQDLSFNLSMTTAQQDARAQVPLPYVHEGKPPNKVAPSSNQGVILYDPDSADDIDDDDPDEDLDI